MTRDYYNSANYVELEQHMKNYFLEIEQEQDNIRYEIIQNQKVCRL